MANFQAHITGSTLVGIGYGYWGVTTQDMSIESGVLAASLCAVSGMLPDLDSDSGVPLRETSMFVAAIAPMLAIERLQDFGLSHEMMAVAAVGMYIGIRFVAVEFFKRYTVHRGMWHSLPAAASAFLIAYIAMPCPTEAIRIYKSAAVFVGFMTHLVMDEIWSIDFRRARVKRSFGTALKLFGNNFVGNVSVYAKLAALAYIAFSDHAIVDRVRQRTLMQQEIVSSPTGSNVPSEFPSFLEDTFNRESSGAPSWFPSEISQPQPNTVPQSAPIWQAEVNDPARMLPGRR